MRDFIDLFRSQFSELLPLGLDADAYQQLFREPVPRQLGIGFIAFYRADVDEETRVGLMYDFLTAFRVLDELLEYEEFLREFVPPGVVRARAVDVFEALPDRFWFEFPNAKFLRSEQGFELQVVFFDADKKLEEGSLFFLAFAMSNLDRWIMDTGTVEPGAHIPMLSRPATAKRHAQLIRNVFSSGIGKWSRPLAKLRNLLLIGQRAGVEDEPIVQAMRAFAASGKTSYLD